MPKPWSGANCSVASSRASSSAARSRWVGVWEVIRIALVGGVPRSELELYEKEGLLQNPSRGLRGNKDGVRLKVPLPYPSRKGKGPVSHDLEDRTHLIDPIRHRFERPRPGAPGRCPVGRAWRP